MTNALIVVDVQNDFITGSLAVPQAEEILQPLVDHIYETNYEYRVATLDWHIDPGDHFSDTPDYIDSWPAHCVAFTNGALLHEIIEPVHFDAMVLKGEYSAAYSGFEGLSYGLPLAQWLSLHDVTEVDVVGLAFDYCVKATALDAVKHGLKTRVLLTLTRAVSTAGWLDAFCDLDYAGVEIIA